MTHQAADNRATQGLASEPPWFQRFARLWVAHGTSTIPQELGLADLDRSGSSARVWTPDLVILSIVAVLTALFGHALAKVKFPGTSHYLTGEQARQIYETAIVATVAFVVWRLRPATVLARMRRALPLFPLLLLWAAGLIATARGLLGFGVNRVLPDIGLVEYSVFVPLVALVIDTREKAIRILAVVFFAGVVETIGFGVLYVFFPYNVLLTNDAWAGKTMYMALFVLPVLARFSLRNRVTPVELVIAATGLALISATAVRSAVLGLAAALLTIVLLVPRARRLVATGLAISAIVLSVGGALMIERIDQLRQQSSPLSRFVADDAASKFSGGRVVAGDAAEGRFSRELVTGERLVAQLGGLVPGQTYTVVFAVKPLQPVATSGFVGNPTGLGWGQQYWTAAPISSWQFFRETLTAKASTDTVGFGTGWGAYAVLFDAVKVMRGRQPGPASLSTGRPSAPTSALPPPPSRPAPSAQPTPVPAPHRGAKSPKPASSKPNRFPHTSQPSLPRQHPAPHPRPASPALPLVTDLGNIAGGTTTGSASNVSWRIAFWANDLKKTLSDPVFGVGFGRPSDFRWHGITYDGRTGSASVFDVIAPHNSFVNLVYRTGLLGLLALLALVVVAALRLVRVLRSETLGAFERALLVGCAAVFVFAAVMASFNEALEAPYMAFFFWVFLGLLLVLPGLFGPPEGSG
jgi:hypothetical protein